MVVVHLVGLLVAGNPDLFAVNNNNVVTHVHVRGVLRLVLATQPVCYLSGEPSQGLVFRVDHKPVVVDVSCLGAVGFHVLTLLGRNIRRADGTGSFLGFQG